MLDLRESIARTGVAGLDDILAGGLIRGRLFLLEGSPGTGKTTIALQFLSEFVDHHPGLRLGKAFGMPAAFAGRRMFACAYRGEIACRLSRDDLPPDLRAVPSAAPADEVDKAPAGALFLVMTHSHPLDLEICARVLQRNDVAYLGLIGSETKRARFAGRLRAIGVPAQALARLTCPIGIPGITGKEPAVIAASVAAQLLIVAERRQAAASAADARGVGT